MKSTERLENSPEEHRDSLPQVLVLSAVEKGQRKLQIINVATLCSLCRISLRKNRYTCKLLEWTLYVCFVPIFIIFTI
jgi:hypothetical protein